MSLIVETGSGNIESESYVSVAACSAYCALQGLTFDIPLIRDAESALRRATQFIDYTYRMRFIGTRTKRRLQALEWPRIGAYYYNADDIGELPYFSSYAGSLWPYDVIDQTTIPIEIVNATCQAAVFENKTTGVLLIGTPASSLTTANTPTGNITKVKAGGTEIDYDNKTSSSTVQVTAKAMTDLQAGMVMIEATLAPLINVAQYTVRAVRR